MEINNNSNKQINRNNQRKRYLYILGLVVCDLFIVCLSVLASFLITKTPLLASNYFISVAFILASVFVIFSLFGQYSVVFSSVNIFDALKLFIAVSIVALLTFLFACVNDFEIINLRMLIVASLLIYILCLSERLAKRIVKAIMSYLKLFDEDSKRVMIVGGGSAGEMLIKELLTSKKSLYRPVCIADDDEKKLGKLISSVRVVGNTLDITSLVAKYDVEEIFVTMPSVDKKKHSQIIGRCKDCGVPVKVLPGIYQLASGSVSVSNLRSVDIQDLLGREPVKVNLSEIIRYIEDKVVLVTGGGGSIGSELCRQIASHNPKTLIILDIYENNAYDIQCELARRYPNLNLLALIASVRDKGKMRDIFEKYHPQIVFHAAAHKHVPLMETSPNEAVKNNVFGTLNVAKLADEFKTEVFVQISTDKAVNPTNVMGATKRICEMIIQTIGKHSKHTKFVAVRFGNVLGSNGSVIPLFKKQIEEGGPVTVTHKDIIRYFMIIPEAVSLVLQAGAYAKGGQIFVLDMGEPVKIYDLACNLIKLSGLKPNEDIQIVCTGLRPGEKLYEERLLDEEGLEKTPNGLINIARPLEIDENLLWNCLDLLYKKAYEETEEMKNLVKDLVPTYVIDKRN